MVKRTRSSKRDEASQAAISQNAPDTGHAETDWNARTNGLWGAPLREQLQFWIEAWDAFQDVAKTGSLHAIDAAPDWMLSATTLVRCSMLFSGESQGNEVGELQVQLAAIPHGFNGFQMCASPKAKLQSCSLVKLRKAWPEQLVRAGARSEQDIRRVLSQDHLLSRLRVRPTSLLARLAVTVFRSGGVLMKQKAHLLHTGLDKKPAKQLEKLMTPRGQWTTTGLGTVDGDYLRLSTHGRNQAERLVDLGVAALGSQDIASGN